MEKTGRESTKAISREKLKRRTGEGKLHCKSRVLNMESKL